MSYHIKERLFNDEQGYYHYPAADIEDLKTLYSLKWKEDLLSEEGAYYVSDQPSLVICKTKFPVGKSLFGIALLSCFNVWMVAMLHSTFIISMSLFMILSLVTITVFIIQVPRDYVEVKRVKAIDDFIPYQQRFFIAHKGHSLDTIRKVNEYYALEPVKRKLESVNVDSLEQSDKKDYFKMKNYIDSLRQTVRTLGRTSQESF